MNRKLLFIIAIAVIVIAIGRVKDRRVKTIMIVDGTHPPTFPEYEVGGFCTICGKRIDRRP